MKRDQVPIPWTFPLGTAKVLHKVSELGLHPGCHARWINGKIRQREEQIGNRPIGGLRASSDDTVEHQCSVPAAIGSEVARRDDHAHAHFAFGVLEPQHPELGVERTGLAAHIDEEWLEQRIQRMRLARDLHKA